MKINREKPNPLHRFLDGLRIEVPAEYRSMLERRTALINYRRARLMIPFLLIMGFFLIFTDFYYHSLWETKPGYTYFYWLDAILVVVLPVFYLLFRNRAVRSAEEIRPLHQTHIYLFAAFISLWCGVSAAIEEMVSQSVTTLIIYAFTLAVVSYLRGWILLLLYLAALAAFKLTLQFLQMDPVDFIAANINLVVLCLLAWAVSRILYKAHIRNVLVEEQLRQAGVMLEERVKERTGELTAANRKLKQEMDIRRKTMTSLQESETKFRALTETASSAIFIVQGEYFKYVNPATEQIIGYTCEEMKKIRFWELVHPDHRELVRDRGMARQRNEALPSRYEFKVVTKKGADIWLDFSATFIDYEGAPAMLGTAFDITRLKEATDALRESEEKYRLLVENANDAIVILQDDRIVFSNPKAWQTIGYTQENLSRIPFQELIHPEDREMVMELYRKRMSGMETDNPYAFRILTGTGEEVWGQVNSVLVQWEKSPAILGFIRDITHQKKLEAQFHRAQRMEAIGTLAGGVAHDVNNLLMGIQGYVSLMLFNLDATHPHYEKLKNIEASVESGSTLTRQLLGFARGGKYEVRLTDLNRLIRERTRMFSATRAELTMQENYRPDLWNVTVDRGQIEQVLLNLYINAWQAMPAGGTITVTTGNVILDEERAKALDVYPGTYVRFSVTDTGEGMDPATQQRIFEPFFTTKERGKGTGLGLASVYGIVRNHGGAVEVFSRRNRGTTFDVYLPAAGDIPGEESDTAPGEGKERKGVILLVDDEELVLDVGRQMLDKLGYDTITAESGREAVAVYRQHRDTVSLVILDMVMPGMGGEETFDLLRSVHPGVKVLLSSGYSEDDQTDRLRKKGAGGFIQKPFRLMHLSRRMEAVLAG